MSRSNKHALDPYLPQLQSDYERELFERICKVLEDKGISIQDEAELKHLFQERLKRSVTDGITTMTLDGIEILAYGELHAEFEGKEIKTSYKFMVL